jgi:hypothetical protein
VLLQLHVVTSAAAQQVDKLSQSTLKTAKPVVSTAQCTHWCCTLPVMNMLQPPV